ncbi:MAG TPA: hypothetical protein VHW26_06650 [Solirubrobacteraceae bacterium]|jgi:hypothetical protein|nr:hypothetical protein [Solirubrobacteraceae bacterium]
MSPSSKIPPWRFGAVCFPLRCLTAFAGAGTVALILATTPAPAVASVAPTLYADGSPGTMVGRQIYDHTNLMAGHAPTGTITFRLYGPGDAACRTPVFTSTVGVSGTGSDNSPSYLTPAAGTYNWVAAYNGDANNSPVATPCGSSSQVVNVGKATPVVTTAATFDDGSIEAVATLKWGFAPPTGSITYTVTGPDDPSCTGAPVYTATVPVNGAGDYGSGSFTPTVAGTYTYQDSYSGDASNYGVGPASCSTQGDAVTVTQGQLAPPQNPPVSPPAQPLSTPALYVDASPGSAVGHAIFDHANLLGGASPTGTITFSLYGPGDTACQTPVFSSTVGVSGSGSDDSSTFVTSAAGTYNWTATYGGDGSNNSVQSACGSASEAVIVGPATPVVTPTASISGGVIRATAALQWGFGSPTGTITFYVTGPNDQFCSGTPVYTQTVAAAGDGSYSSGPFAPTVAGTYTVRIRYSGDANNYGVGPTGCITQGDAVTVAQSQLAPGLN